VDYQQLLHALLVMQDSFVQLNNSLFLQGTHVQMDVENFQPNEFYFAEDYGNKSLGDLSALSYFWSSLALAFHSSANSLNCQQKVNSFVIIMCADNNLGYAANTSEAYQAVNHLIDARKALAVDAGEFSAEEKVEFNAKIKAAALAWERYIAVKVIQRINAVNDELEESKSMDEFATLMDFTQLANNWSAMRGFALGLQFNPFSSFYDSPPKFDALKTMLLSLGTAPVLANGTQHGKWYPGGVDQYQRVLMEARDLLQLTYSLNSEDTAVW
jgi:hypothetical protein